MFLTVGLIIYRIYSKRLTCVNKGLVKVGMGSRNLWKYPLLGCGLGLLAGVVIFKILNRYRNVSRSRDTQIHFCCSWADWIKYEKLFLSAVQSSKVIGLDCEWVTFNDERQPVALLQLAPASDICVLIRLCCLLPEEVPNTLMKILQDSTILKVGVNVCGDAQKLFDDYDWNVKGCFDLRYLIKGDPKFKDIWNRGLRALAGRVLNVNINKSVQISCSDWEAHTLSSDQVVYAAEDAIVAFQIFQKLCPYDSRKPFLCFPFRKPPYFLKKELREFIDVPFKTVNNHPLDNKKLNIRPLCKSKAEKVLSRAKKNPDFDNCFLVAPDGEPLCTCDKGKANWYLEKDLGELVREDPFIVRLKFEPSGRPILDNKYYIQEKKSGCVVCGNNDHIFRKTVVPHEYRRYFPELMKKNLSHDILLLCTTCHRLSNALDRSLRDQLAEECDAPIGSGTDLKQQEDVKLCKVKSAARALLNTKNNIPPAKKEMLREVIQEHFGITELSEEVIKKASGISTFVTNDNYIPHGLKVYQHMCENGGLMAFESRWRQHFLDTMHPKFLPNMWSIDHNHERLALQVSKKEVDFDISILGISREMYEKVKNM